MRALSCVLNTAQRVTTAEHRGARGRGLLVSRSSQGPLGRPRSTPQQAAACVWHKTPRTRSHTASLRPRLRHHCRLCFFTQHVSQPTGGIRNSKFSKQFQYFQYICWGFNNSSWPEKVQHLPHTDTGPFPVLGISVLCWSNSDSNFKMFSAAMSWQDSTSFPIPWLIRGG